MSRSWGKALTRGGSLDIGCHGRLDRHCAADVRARADKRLMAAPPRRRAMGFTLVELVMVIGISVLLMALVLPAVTRAKEQSRLTACQSRMKKIGAAVITYASFQNGVMPPIWMGPDVRVRLGRRRPKTGWVSWKWLLVRYLNLPPDGTKSAMGGSQGVWLCPEQPFTSNEYKPKSKFNQRILGDEEGRVVGDVNAHRAMNREIMERYNGQRKIDSFKHPDSTIMIVEHTWHGASVGVEMVDETPTGDAGGPLVHWHMKEKSYEGGQSASDAQEQTSTEQEQQSADEETQDSAEKESSTTEELDPRADNVLNGANYVMPDGHVEWSTASAMIAPECRWHDLDHEKEDPHADVVENLRGDETPLQD